MEPAETGKGRLKVMATSQQRLPPALLSIELPIELATELLNQALSLLAKGCHGGAGFCLMISGEDLPPKPPQGMRRERGRGPGRPVASC